MTLETIKLWVCNCIALPTLALCLFAVAVAAKEVKEDRAAEKPAAAEPAPAPVFFFTIGVEAAVEANDEIAKDEKNDGKGAARPAATPAKLAKPAASDTKAVKVENAEANAKAKVAEAEEKPQAVKAAVKERAKKEAKAEAADKEAPAAAAAVNGRVVFGAPVAAPPAAVDQDVLKAQTQQFALQFRPQLMAELGLIRLVCSDLSKEQRAKVKAAGEASLQDAAKKFAEFQLAGNRRQVVLGGILQRVVQPKPATIIREGLGEALEETLAPEAMARYTQEAAKRSEKRKQAAILIAIACFDGSLYLTAEQREKIGDKISSQWQDEWESWLMLSMYNGQYVPQIPDPLIVPQLTTEQKAVWQGLQKINFGNMWNNGGEVAPDDDWWGDPPAAGNFIFDALRVIVAPN